MAARLAIASLVVCGLLVMEDPLVVAVRSRIDGSPTGRIAFDCALAIVMVAYNFASSRYVVSVTSASVILDAMSVVDDQRAQDIAGIRNPVWRGVRLVARHLNPFDLIKWAGDRLGRSIEQVSMSARQRRFRRTAALFEDLSAVNVLGVPGASLALSTRGYPVSRVRSVRHCVLFVASWFVGARIIEWVVGRARLAPVFGDVVATVTHAIGAVFSTLTDVTRPVGLIAISALVVSVVRYSRRVERTIRQMAHST